MRKALPVRGSKGWAGRKVPAAQECLRTATSGTGREGRSAPRSNSWVGKGGQTEKQEETWCIKVNQAAARLCKNSASGLTWLFW